MSLLDKASLIITPNGYKENVLYSVVPNTTLGDMTVVRATTARRVNSLSLIESVANNVPRIDYTNGSCPSLLVEPQRTNLYPYSNEFDNGVWNKARMSIVANTMISPDGLQNADSFVENTALDSHPLYSFGFVTVIGQSYTVSIFVKKGSRDSFVITPIGGGNAIFNLANGTTSTSGAAGAVSAIKLFSNDFYRCSYTFTATLLSTEIYLEPAINGGTFYQGNGSTSLYIYGFQLEQGSYPTSYIPTVATTVTRNADVISKTGISSLIGQTEGTVFVDASNKILGQTNRTLFSVNDAANNNFILLNYSVAQADTLRFFVLSNGGLGALAFKIVTTPRVKLAVSYNAGTYKLFINGVLQHTQSGGTFSANLANISLGSNASLSEHLGEDINSFQVYKTQLTDAECIELTTL